MDLTLINAMAFCVVGEGSPHYWWDLLKIDHNPRISSSAASPGYSQLARFAPRKWKGVLLRSFLEAQAYWSTEANMLSEPLESYMHVVKRSPNTYWNLLIAVPFSWLANSLTCADKAGIEVKTYNESIAHASVYRPTKYARGLDIVGYLELMHPTNPCPDLLLHLFRDAERDSEKMELLEAKSFKGLKMMASRLAQRCHRNGDSTAANQVIDITLGVLRRKLANTNPVDRYGRRRKATKHEIEGGVPIDADGYVVRDSLLPRYQG